MELACNRGPGEGEFPESPPGEGRAGVLDPQDPAPWANLQAAERIGPAFPQPLHHPARNLGPCVRLRSNELSAGMCGVGKLQSGPGCVCVLIHNPSVISLARPAATPRAPPASGWTDQGKPSRAALVRR